jgi:hypothetical protein
MACTPLDELRPLCPACRGAELRRIAAIGDPMAGEFEGVVYDCPVCRRTWIDQFTGEALVLARSHPRSMEG